MLKNEFQYLIFDCIREASRRVQNVFLWTLHKNLIIYFFETLKNDVLKKASWSAQKNIRFTNTLYHSVLLKLVLKWYLLLYIAENMSKKVKGVVHKNASYSYWYWYHHLSFHIAAKIFLIYVFSTKLMANSLTVPHLFFSDCNKRFISLKHTACWIWLF